LKTVAAKQSTCAIVIVTYNSGCYLETNLKFLNAQTKKPERIVIVDSASPDASFLPESGVNGLTVLRQTENVGFCRGNNIGACSVLDTIDYLLFLNPDAFLPPAFIQEAVAWMDATENKNTGILTGRLLGFDMDKNQPTGRVDSTGIFQKWYGRWYDRSQGEPVEQWREDAAEEYVPAICGALMFCRTSALKSVQIQGQVFDESFYMYKEDIELSIRTRRQGWNTVYVPKLSAYHCRGWQSDRKKMSFKSRLLSARNDARLALRYPSLGIVYALAKLAYVRWCEGAEQQALTAEKK